MTKSKKLISMLLAFVMLVTSCSLSFFAFAADSAEAIAEAEAAAAAAFSDTTKINAGTSPLANTYIEKLTALENPASVSPVHYAFALQVVTPKIILADGLKVNNKNKGIYLKNLANGDATVTAKYKAILGTVPAAYLAVLKDYNDVNVATTDSASGTKTINILASTLGDINFPTNADALTKWNTLWANYKNYTAEQMYFSDALTVSTSDGVYINLNNNATSIGGTSTYDATLTALFGVQQATRIGNLFYSAEATPPKAKGYIKSNKWIDTTNGASNFYAAAKAYVNNSNTNSKQFFVKFFTAYDDASRYKGTRDAVEKVITVGLKLKAGEEVAFSEVKEAYKAYNDLSDRNKAIINCVTDKVRDALFNMTFSNADFTTEYAKGDTAAIAWLNSNPRTVAGSSWGYSGDTFKDLWNAVANEYTEKLPINDYKEYVDAVIESGNITEENVTTTWSKFNDLTKSFQEAVRNSTDLWGKTVTIMTSDFVNYVNGVDLNNVTDANRTESTEKLENTVEEFKNLLINDDDFKDVYEKYIAIQISDFRNYVEGVDLNNVTAENRTTATAKYDALTDEFKTIVQADTELYNTYLAILASEFKDYINSIDLDKVDDSVRDEAKNKYQQLSDAAKKTAYEDDATWNKYCQIQTPDVDEDKHSKEAAKKADKETLPTTSKAINALGEAKSIDNVENFVIDDLLPTLTDQIKIDDKNDVVNAALEQYLTNETVGKIYSLYASLSHNQTEVNGAKVGDLVKMAIPAGSMVVRFYENDFAPAKGKIYNAIATNAIPTEEVTDEDGNTKTQIVQIKVGVDEDDNAIYEDANIYDGIAAIQFENGDFGFQDGDRDGFENAVLAALRPLTGLLVPGASLGGLSLGVELFNHVDKANGEYTLGLYESCLTLLEALGVTDMMTDDQYKLNYYTILQTTYATAEGTEDEKNTKAASIAGDAILRPLIDGVFRLVDSELKTIPDILALIPRLGDIIQSDVPSVVYKNLVADLGLLSGLVSGITIEELPLSVIVNKNVLPNALLKLVNDKLAGLGITLAMPNWNELNKYTTFKVNKSAQQNKDYVAVRYINGDAMFTELVYYAYDNLFGNKENAEALKQKIGGIPLVGSNISALVDKAVAAGKLDTYAAILDYFYDDGTPAPDATADAGKSIGEAIAGINATLNLSPIDASKAVVKVTKRKFAYNGKIQKPSVTVTLNGEKLTKGVAYKVSYSNNSSKKIGTYKVTVTFIGGYEGKAKTVKYTIGPKNAKKIKLTAKKNAIKVSWNKSASKETKGYIIKYSTSKNFKKAKTLTVKGRNKTSATISKLTSGKKYYVRIKSYTVKSGKKIYSPYSIKKAATVK